jgi:hypothetical protein
MRRRLRGRLGGDVELSWWWSNPGDGRVALDLRDEASARAFARQLGSIAENLAPLRAMIANEAGSGLRLDEDALLVAVAAALRSGRLRASAVPWAPLSAKDGEGDSQPDAREWLAPLAPSKTWIAMKLLGEDDQPIPGARYWIKLPDETVREGYLDGQGYAYFGDLDPGQCEIRWPDLDDGAVSATSAQQVAQAQRASGSAGAGAGAGSRSPARGAGALDEARTWVAIELLGEDDAPLGGEAYWIKLPGGAIREGTLDASGRAYFDDLDPGDCEIRWPGLDRQAVAPATAAPAPR